MATALSVTGTNPLVCPPAVDYPLSRPWMLLGTAGFVWGLVLAVHAYWLVAAAAHDWRPWVGLLIAAGAGVLAWRCRPLTQSGALVWDGAAWFWVRPAIQIQGRLGVRLDVQSGMLVQFQGESGAAHWFWLDRASRPSHWLALRRAAHAAVSRPAAARAAGQQAAQP